MLLIVWLEVVEMKCSVLLEIEAAVLGKLKLWILPSSDWRNVDLLAVIALVGVLIEFFASEVSLCSACRIIWSVLLIVLFLPLKIEF